MRRTLIMWVVVSALLAGSAGGATLTDPYLEEQWGLDVIEALEAWKITRGDGATIAILDSGFDANHPDLRRNIARGVVNLLPDVGNADRDGSHGTFVSGIAAAVGNNSKGVSGVAPDATILPIRVCDRGDCDAEAVARGIRYAVRHDADVINLSIYVALSSPAVQDVIDAVDYAHAEGSVVVGAAGNNSEPVCVEPASSAICVGAVDYLDQKASYSNGDVAMMDTFLVAPGGAGPSCEEMILSTTAAKQTACRTGGRYASSFGTSAAAPFVSGVAALLASAGAGPELIRRCLIESADDLGLPGRDPIFGYGRLNARAAVECAKAAG